MLKTNNCMSNYLFVCKAGKIRSPTAVRAANFVAKKHCLELKAEATGTAIIRKNGWNAEKLNNYDKIFVMEPYMQRFLTRKYGVPEEKIVCFDIEDIYQRKNDVLLYTVLEQLIEEYFFDGKAKQ